MLSYAAEKRQWEREYLTRLLTATEGNVAEAARIARRNRTKLYSVLKRVRINPKDFRGETPCK